MEGKGGIHVRQMAGQEHMGLEQRTGMAGCMVPV